MIELKRKLPKLGAARFNKKTIIVGLAFITLLIAASYFGWQFFALKNNTEAQNKALAADIKTAVSKIYILPSDEEPTVARIENKDSLKGQTFFDKAQNGDYVIVYEKSKLALLYRQQDGKLVNAGPITTDTSEADAANTTDKTIEKSTSTQDSTKTLLKDKQ